ncbi:MAG: TlpA family protein disulfide reductase [Deltaproteobacteria bacterium]|nr:TlpA family protein disulfide reductase [Deltaproteobacteria bacterium]
MAIVLVVYFLVILEERGGLQKGDLVPHFSLPSMKNSVSLQEYRGKLVLLNFWATWCPPCLAEMPSLDRLNERIGDGFEVIAIGVDDTWSSIQQFLKMTPLTLVILLDQKGEVAEKYGVTHLPISYLIDREGTVLKKYVGPRVWDDPEIISEIKEHLR